MHKFIVPHKPDLAYIAHEVNISKNKMVWCYSFLGRDANIYQTTIAASEEDAKQKAEKCAQDYGKWPEGQKAVIMWPLGVRGR